MPRNKHFTMAATQDVGHEGWIEFSGGDANIIKGRVSVEEVVASLVQV